MQHLFKNNKSLILANFCDLTTLFVSRKFMLQHKIMPDNINGDDCCAIRIFYYAKKCAIVDEAIYYYYYQQENSYSGSINEESFKIKYDYIGNQIKLLNSFENVDKDTYIAFVQRHLYYVYNRSVVSVVRNYKNEEWKNKITFEFIRIVNNEIHLSNEDKEKYIFALLNKNIAKAIKTNDTKFLIKLALKKSQLNSANKFVRLIANIISLFVPFKEHRRKLRHKILDYFVTPIVEI